MRLKHHAPSSFDDVPFRDQECVLHQEERRRCLGQRYHYQRRVGLHHFYGGGHRREREVQNRAVATCSSVWLSMDTLVEIHRPPYIPCVCLALSLFIGRVLPSQEPEWRGSPISCRRSGIQRRWSLKCLLAAECTPFLGSFSAPAFLVKP